VSAGSEAAAIRRLAWSIRQAEKMLERLRQQALEIAGRLQRLT
jgi:hypothetical protein